MSILKYSCSLLLVIYTVHDFKVVDTIKVCKERFPNKDIRKIAAPCCQSGIVRRPELVILV